MEYNAIAAGPPRFVFSVFLASTVGMTHSFAVLGESCGNVSPTQSTKGNSEIFVLYTKLYTVGIGIGPGAGIIFDHGYGS